MKQKTDEFTVEVRKEYTSDRTDHAHKRKHKYKVGMILFMLLGSTLLLSGCDAVLMNPKGVIASDQKDLLILSTLLMLIVVIPVFILTFVFAWKYRAKNKEAKYTPNWAHSTILEIIWWAIPCVIIGMLAYLVWVSSHALDPYKPLEVNKESVRISIIDINDGQHKDIEVMAVDANVKPVIIEVVALDWKWLFIYPEYNIATINYIQFPAHVPLNFKITADAPMNSFVIPALGGQIYAMEGMQTKMHYIANEEGVFKGRSVNYSGVGFAGMKFLAKASSDEEFEAWIEKVKQSDQVLTISEYDRLVEKSENNPVAYYSSVKKGLFREIIMRFMTPNMHKEDRSDKPVEL
jgi:cytochrome o ubiquinol oxidase subunit 2